MIPDFISEYLNTIVVVIALLVGGLATLNREAVKTLRETNKDLSDRIVVLESNEKRNQAEIDKLREENKTLRTLVTNEVKLGVIERLIETHHKEAVAYWASLGGRMDKILSEMEKCID